jgi:serine/threonine protein kinase/tetratricopeptide (TPR) repeat protein
VSDERAKTALQVFEAALAIPPHQREDWVERECGHDSTLSAEVKSLLAAHAEAGDFLDSDLPDVRLPRSTVYLAPAEFGPGRQVGEFLIERQIGSGGMGLVYRAQQISLKRPVALKVLPHHLHSSENARVRFQREIEAAARLSHPNVVAVYTTGEVAGTMHYAMELIEGPALNHVIDELRRCPLPELKSCGQVPLLIDRWGGSTRGQTGDLTPQPGDISTTIDMSVLARRHGYFIAVANLMADVADGLAYAHLMHVVHRDVKPSNLLLSHDGRIHIGDFGLARLAQEPGLTRTGDVLGTPFYMAPEQISATAGDVDERTDVYGLGATLYELLTLVPPFMGDHRDIVTSKILRDEPPAPRSLNRLVPRDLETICLKAIEKQPTRRYPSARAMSDDLRRFAEGLPVAARRTGPVGHGIRWVERHRAWAAALTAMCALVVVALFFAYRTYIAESRWTDAEFGRIYETAQLAAIEGNLRSAGEAIGEAEQLGAPTAQLALLRGQLDFHSGRFQEACDQLELAARDMPESLAAHALLTNAYGANEQHENRAKAATRLASLKPVTLQDYLLLADAQSYNNFSEAHATLDEAVARYKTSVVARLTRGGVLVYRSMEVADVELAESAIDDLRIASELLEPNSLLLGRMMQARLVAAAAYESIGNSQRRQKHLDQAALTAEELRRFSGQYHADLWRAVYFDYVGNDDRAVESWLAIKEHSITFLVLTLFRLERFQEAMDLCDERLARHKKARFTDFFRSFILSAMTDSPQEVVAAFEPQGTETLDSLNAHRFAYTIYCLAGNLDAAQQYCRDVRKVGVRVAHDEESWQKILEYTCGDLDAEALLTQISGSRTALCQANFLIGMTHLALGNRDDARKHFRACSSLKINRYVEDFMSRALVAQLDRNPAWPPWIATTDGGTPTDSSVDVR